jgi:hypothetical protein
MSNKSNSTLFAHIPEDEYKRLMEIEQKYYELLAEREDIAIYKEGLEKLRVGEIIVDFERYRGKYAVARLHSIDSWDRINMFTRVLVGEDALKESLRRLYEVENTHRIMIEHNTLKN